MNSKNNKSFEFSKSILILLPYQCKKDLYFELKTRIIGLLKKKRNVSIISRKQYADCILKPYAD